MCLDKLEKYEDKKDIITGYKIFLKNSNGSLGGVYFNTQKRPINEWLDERNYRNINATTIYTRAYQAYPAGWHVFLHFCDAEKIIKEGWYGKKRLKIMKVQCKKLLALGKEVNMCIGIFKYIKIIKEVEKYYI